MESRLIWKVWLPWSVVALLALPVLGPIPYGVLVPASALAVSLVPGAVAVSERHVNGRDLLAVAVLYLVVVALMRLAFTGFTEDHVAGLFLAFGSALLVGVAGPIAYTVGVRRQGLDVLGLGRADLKRTATVALLLAGVQFALTLWGYDLPHAQDWVPLLVMALVVGVFESVFFRGFVQNLVEEQLGTRGGIAAASVLYGLYHVGYGMGGTGLLFLTGLGVVYAVAFGLTRSVWVLWPLLTPLGSFFANVSEGEIGLPWASILGFADVAMLMVVAIWLGARYHRRHPAPGASRRLHLVTRGDDR
jgi:membrane protease YdiL (CAAX protease family)